MLVSLAVTVALGLIASVEKAAPAAYPLAGLSLALVYPMGLIWFTDLHPGDGDGLVILILTMMAGGVLGPALTGLAVSFAGVGAVPVCIAGLAAADFSVFLVARRFRSSTEVRTVARTRPIRRGRSWWATRTDRRAWLSGARIGKSVPILCDPVCRIGREPAHGRARFQR